MNERRFVTNEPLDMRSAFRTARAVLSNPYLLRLLATSTMSRQMSGGTDTRSLVRQPLMFNPRQPRAMIFLIEAKLLIARGF